jgi:phosphomevalonate kinase
VSKTGLGSSAAMTTSLVASLLHFLGVVNISNISENAIDLKVVHNAAQIAHAAAQGKIGSGFDVSAAVYGTQIYKRFDAAKAEKIMELLQPFSSTNLDSCPLIDSALFCKSLLDDEMWTQFQCSFGLPRGLNIVLGDVCGGSSSSSMVRK